MAVCHTHHAVTDLVRAAAARESQPETWRFRFERLFESGLLRCASVPAREFCVQLAQGRGSVTASTVAGFCERTLAGPLRSGFQVCVDLGAVVPDSASDWLASFKTGLMNAHRAAAFPLTRLSFSLQLGHPNFHDFLSLRHWRELDFPCIAVRYPGGASAVNPDAWNDLVMGSHSDARIIPVPEQSVRPLSGLHAAEISHCVMPASRFAVPAESAWLNLEIDARNFATPGALRLQLADCLRFADNLIDTLQWPTAVLQLDAVLNRRVAIRLSHIGQHVAQLGLSPVNSDTYSRVQRWLMFVRHCFVHASMRLAQHRGPFPDLCARDLLANLEYRYGSVEAQRLLKNRMLRHRHLLALSPHAMFPAACAVPAAEKWINLVPAISCADAIAMHGPDVRHRLSVENWSRLLRLTGAIATNNVKTAPTFSSGKSDLQTPD